MTTKKLDLSEYKDDSAERLKELIEAKIQGRELATPEAVSPEPPVINMFDALKESLARVQVPGRAAARKPDRKMAPSAAARTRRAPARRKKSG